MKNTNETIKKIPSHYVGEDCIQIMFAYQNTLTIINPDGILYHHKPESDIYINKYLEDERRKQFPYSNIPTHFSKYMFQKISHTNQLLDFEKPYIRIGDGWCLESFVIKDNNQALLVNRVLQSNKTVKYMTYDELLKYIEKNNTEEQIYYVYLSGALQTNNNELFPTEEEIHNRIREYLEENISDFERERNDYNSTTGIYLRNRPMFFELIRNIKNVDFSSIDFNIKIKSPLLIVRINEGNIKVQGIEVTFVRDNNYKVDIYDLPVTKYVLEQLKYVSKISKTSEPKIPLRLNPGVTRQDIKDAKQMIKTLKK